MQKPQKWIEENPERAEAAERDRRFIRHLVTHPKHGMIPEMVPGVVIPALCLDLDGTIRYSKDGEFINKPEDVALYPDVEEVIWRYRNDGYLIFGITNQGGVAYGYKHRLDHDMELERTLALFERNPFHVVKACFHHPEGKVKHYAHRSLLRKPAIGMLVLCEVEAWDEGYIVDWDNSLFVGDRQEDYECAINAGIKFQYAHRFFDREPPDDWEPFDPDDGEGYFGEE